jgi:undecaprenyl-phosphate 4-deoxy-4-formamido-L-arabinose transferase
MRSDRLLSVVIPVYRSEAYLADTVRELLTALGSRGPLEIVLVNDGSPDRVQGVIDDLTASDRRVRSVTLAHNVGQHRATLQGFAVARGDIVVTVDDDGQNPPAACLAVVEALEEGDLDVVYGRFEVVEQGLARRFASALNARISRLTLRNVRDIALSNVRALRGDLARLLGRLEHPYPYIDAMIFRVTSRIADTPVEQRPRARGTSTYGLAGLVRLWISHLTSLSVVPLQLATMGCFGASGLGLVIGVVQLVRALWRGQAPAGWLSLFCAVTFLFALLFAFLGVVSAYLGRMYVTMNERGLVWIREGDRPEGERVPLARPTIRS